MKINWSWGITIAILSYMAFILFMVYKTTTVEHSLVSEDYYAKEISYEKTIEKTKNANRRGNKITVSMGQEGVKVLFPEAAKKGNIHFFRVDGHRHDFEIPIALSEKKSQTIWHNNLKPGKWILKIDWEGENGKAYYDEIIWFMPAPKSA